MTEKHKKLLENIKMLVMDVDGVMTDGGLYYDSAGQVTKRFNVQDGLGIKLAQAAGLELGVITGLSSPAVEARIKELGIRHYFHGFTNKVPLLQKIAETANIPCEQMAYIGDDWVDAGPMLMVGFPMAVSNAQPEIKELAAWTAACAGGKGAVREAIRFILSSQNRYLDQWEEWKGINA